MTKVSVTVSRPLDIRYLLEKSLWLAESGRPSPVWLDIPIDIQSSFIEPARLRGFDPVAEGYGHEYAIPGEYGWLTGAALDRAAQDVVSAIREARRPVLMPGTGIRIAGVYEPFLELADKRSAEHTSELKPLMRISY